ncbi:hypothetical protein GF406_03440 [candidate division KSB1 bacterium]|nr:hypothetical protein [candidate division KSB1 bacterium]
MKCLIYNNQHKSKWDTLSELLGSKKIPFERVDTLAAAVKTIQEQDISVLVLDSHIDNMHIDEAIRVFKCLAPKLRILVSTDRNSKSLETRVRKEQVFYYHVDMSGLQELELAITTAWNRCIDENQPLHSGTQESVIRARS